MLGGVALREMGPWALFEKLCSVHQGPNGEKLPRRKWKSEYQAMMDGMSRSGNVGLALAE